MMNNYNKIISFNYQDLFLEEQCSGLSHLTDERRKLAEERSKLNLEQKLYREQMQDAAIRLAQVRIA